MLQLWTIQPIEWYNELQKCGVISGQASHIDKDYLEPYHWLINEMDKRIGQRPFSDCYPVWAWYQYKDIQKRKPDLRSTGFLPKGTKGVRIEIRKKAREVLLSDFELWHSPLNYWKIDDNEQETDEFYQFLAEKNIEFTDKAYYPPEIKQQVKQSWNKIFDMDYAPEYSSRPFWEKSIQATFWTLSIDEIVKVEEFTAR